MDYRGTLNLPETAFPMRANASKREPEMLSRWSEIGVYERMLAQRDAAPLFILHDGPPYANGNMHMGHVLNRVLKDIVVKYKHLSGHRTPYVPGWDCHGLPIELQVEKEVGRAKKAELPVVEVRRLCDAYARKFVDIQRGEVKRLGVVGDWDHPYLTLAPEYEAQEIRELGKLASAGALYRRKKPVYWCASCETALAEAEVEYEEKRSYSIHVKFPAARGDTKAAVPVALLGAVDPAARDALQAMDARSVALVAWTTTPWTLPANLALSLNPEFAYVGLHVGGELLIVAEGLVDAFLRDAKLAEDEGKPRLRFEAKSLENVEFHHPWLDRRVPVLLGDHVTLETGTGVVHTAPGHGQEDYEIGLRYGLDVYSPVDASGRFTKDVPELQGERIFDADKKVVERIREAGTLIAEGPFTHSYPHCWRCKKPLFFRATEQWFVSLSTNHLREETLAAIDRVRWIPPWGRDRIHGMISTRPDWCISRQRSWGVPIVAVHCDHCGHAHASKELAEHVAGIVEREGSNAWFAHPVAELLPAGFRCERCGSHELRKETDILDVWFDSGVSHASVLERRPELRSPADLYLEGSDQHRGWFHTSILTSVATRGNAPYIACLTHGFILDGQGKKMSKSGGNAMSPDAIMKDLGADVLRLWVAAEDYRGDVKLSKEILSHLVEAYRRVRNTARFLLGNLGGFDPQRDTVPYAELPELDRYALDRLARVVQRARDGYESYEFHAVYHLLNNFCAVDMSALYLDVVKDRAYCSAPDDRGRRAAQTVMYEIVRALAGLLAPVLTFLAEDIWHALPGGGGSDSVLLSDFPTPRAEWLDDALAERFDKLLAVRSAVTKALEVERQAGRIKQSMEARVTLAPPKDIAPLLRERAASLAELFIVSEVTLADGPLPESPVLAGLGVEVAAARGEKCTRCWNYRLDVSSVAAFPGACGRCADVLGRAGHAVAS